MSSRTLNGRAAARKEAVKLGRWPDYLAMRQRVLELNATVRDLLSNDLGAIGGLLFDIGSGHVWSRQVKPARAGEGVAP